MKKACQHKNVKFVRIEKGKYPLKVWKYNDCNHHYTTDSNSGMYKESDYYNLKGENNE